MVGSHDQALKERSSELGIIKNRSKRSEGRLQDAASWAWWTRLGGAHAKGENSSSANDGWLHGGLEAP